MYGTDSTRSSPCCARWTPQVGLVHRRDRMCAHRRMAVDAEDRAAGLGCGEQIAEQAVAAEVRLAADDRHEAVGDEAAGRHATAAPMLPTSGELSKVEQHLVVHDGRARARRRSARPGSSSAAIACGRERARRRRRCPTQSSGPAASSIPARRHAQEQQRAQPGARRGGQRVGRAGEVVAVEADARRQRGLRAPKNSSARAAPARARARTPRARRRCARPPTPGAGSPRRPPGRPDARGCRRRTGR